MSMVIMNAWKTPFKTLDEIIIWSKNIRPKMYELADEKFNCIVTESILDSIDYIFKNMEFPEKAVRTMSKRYKPNDFNPDRELDFQVEIETIAAMKYEAISPERNPKMDFRSEMVFIPHNGNIYAQWFGDDREWEKLFNTLGWEEYWYDGRTDGEGEIPYEEYEARGNVWSEIFDEMDSPSEVGVVVDLLAGKYYNYTKQIITEAMRSEVIEFYVKEHILYQTWLNIGNNKAETEEKLKTGGIFSAYSEYREWTNTDEAKKKKISLIEEYSKKYPSVEKINEYFSMKPTDILKDMED